MVLSPGISRAQFKQGDVWVLGYNYEQFGTGEPSSVILDFSTGSLQVYESHTAINIFMTNSSLSDKNGNLLLYSNGAKIADGTHQILIDTICPSEKYEQNQYFGYIVTDGVVLFESQHSDSANILFIDYSLFQTDTSVEFPSYIRSSKIGINSRVDRHLIPETSFLIDDTLVIGLLSITKHLNLNEWWVILWEAYTYKSIVLKIGENFVIKYKGESYDIPGSIIQFAHMGAFSLRGDKYARFGPNHLCALFDFNREDGELSNYKSWIVDEGKYGLGGVSFSPSGRFLYLSTGPKLFQYDTEAENIADSEVLIAEWDGYKWLGIATTGFNMHKNTPDCRIFISTTGATPYLHVIHHPDEKGAVCGFEMRGIELPWPHDRGLPNIPNYRLGTPEENYCDSIKVNTNELIRGWLPAISPNPVSDQLRIVWPQSVDIQIIHIVDIQGRIIHRERPGGGSREQLISSEGWNSGTYIVELIAADGSRVVRKVVKQ